MKYILALILLSFASEPPAKKCTVYAIGKNPEWRDLRRGNTVLSLHQTAKEYLLLDSLTVSPDSVHIATTQMLKVKGAEFTTIKCKD